MYMSYIDTTDTGIHEVWADGGGKGNVLAVVLTYIAGSLRLSPRELLMESGARHAKKTFYTQEHVSR